MQTRWDDSWLDAGSQSYLEEMYDKYLADPNSVPNEWQQHFSQMTKSTNKDISHTQIKEKFKQLAYNRNMQISAAKNTATVKIDNNAQNIALQKLIMAYRLLGHKISQINPLNNDIATIIPELSLAFYGLDTVSNEKKFTIEDFYGANQQSLTQIIENLNKVYCKTIATEFMHIANIEERLWVQQNLEQKILSPDLNIEKKKQIFKLLVAVEGLEKYLGAKYPGAKRFSIEGCDTMLTALNEIIENASASKIEDLVIAMAHRGRLSVLVNLMGHLPRELFNKFEDLHDDKLESGDVKYHQGFASDIHTEYGNIHLSLAYNPSHLEIVTPVAMGSVRARQERRNDEQRDRVICIAIHGDAAFAGQGVVMETLNMSTTPAYGVGGTIHIIVDNQIGFTTSDPRDARSTLYCSDIGKMLDAPIFHVNADDPEAVVIVANLALEYRMKFHKDVIIDLLGYRRMGHNEADEPAATQPLMYQKIRAHTPVKEIYAQKLIADNIIKKEEVSTLSELYRNKLDQGDSSVIDKIIENKEWRVGIASNWTEYTSKDWRCHADTKVPLETLLMLADKRDKIPDGFTLDPRVKKIVENRQAITKGNELADWGYAETLAYASLLHQGYGVRLSGQDSERGTFFHRHAVWHDHANGNKYTSLQNLSEKQGKFSVYNSLLSELAVLAFEYGYSSNEPKTLTIWEAQFGDFANGAQIVIDQFISSGEQKWGRLSGLVLYLPHGFEGQGPEHSSARIERYMQLCAQHNIQVCIPSTPAQMFHLLRRQMLRPLRKPLIVITPKSLLRHKAALSSLEDIANGQFYPIIPDKNGIYEGIERVILCSGKVFYELDAKRLESGLTNVAIIRMEQLYPFPEEELASELSKYVQAKSVVWCQEEPRNQGAWYTSQHHVANVLLPGQKLLYAGRADSAAPAVGYFSLHEQQQQALVNEALGL